MWSVHSTSDSLKTDRAEACIGCLATDVKLYDIHTYNLAETFMQFIGVSLQNHFPHHLCVFCKQQLQRCAAFRQSCWRVQELLVDADFQGRTLTSAYIRELGHKIKPAYTRTDIKTLELVEIDDNEPEIKQEDSSDSDDLPLSVIETNKKLDFSVDVEKEEVDDKEELDLDKEDPGSDRDYSEKEESESDSEIEPLPVFADSVKKEVKKKPVRVKKERRKKKCKSAEEIKKDANTFNFDVIFLSREEQIQEVTDLKSRQIKYDNKCGLCGKNFKSKKSREAHFKRYHDEEVGCFSCDICQCRFKAKNRLNTHMKIHRERFRCRSCDFVTNRECGLRLHYQFHQGKKYICEYCKKDFSKVSSYMSHVRLIHASLLPWCELCGESFIGEKGVQAHKKRAHKDIEEPTLSCDNCKTNFLDDKALEKHKSLNRCNLSNCVQCGDAFASLQLLKYHLVQKHGSEGESLTSDCVSCGVSFHSNAAFQRHVCGANAVCVQCGDHFEDERALNEHEAKEHTALTFFKCEECDKTFTNAYYFRDHCARGHEHRKGSSVPKEKQPPRKRGRKVDTSKETTIRKWRVVDGERRLVMEKLTSDGQLVVEERIRDAVCEVCGKAFAITHTKKLTFDCQLVVERIWDAMCEVCRKAFSNVSLLKLHQRLHTGEKLFTCTYCNKKFNVSTLLRNHMRVHTGERPFKCSDCPKAFKEWAGYKRHLLSHTGVRKHVCEICQKTFLTSTCVKVHIKTVHMKIPMPPRVRRPRVKNE